MCFIAIIPISYLDTFFKSKIIKKGAIKKTSPRNTLFKTKKDIKGTTLTLLLKSRKLFICKTKKTY